MPAVPKSIQAEHVVCRRCGASVNKLLFRYLYFRFGWRARGLAQPEREASVRTHEKQERDVDIAGVLCEVCGGMVLKDWDWWIGSQDSTGLERAQGTHQP